MNQTDLMNLTNHEVLTLMKPEPDLAKVEEELSRWGIIHIGERGFSYAGRLINGEMETIRMENAETLALVVEFLNGTSTKIILPR